MAKRWHPSCLVVALLFGTTCLAQPGHEHPSKTDVTRAIAVISPTKGNSAHGIVTFEVVDSGVHVTANLSGLTPGRHGFHIHEFGDCSADDALSAGGHFNPFGMPHSMPSSEKRHVGDLGNIEADKDGAVHLEFVDPILKLGGENSIIGRAVIVHEKEDDLKTQPTGNAGARIGCGVIGIAKPK